MLIHTKDCASHKLPICTCGALNRWAAELGKQTPKPKPGQTKAA